MPLTEKNRWIEIKDANKLGSKNGFFVLICYRGTDGKVLRHYCIESLEPIRNFEDAEEAALFVASHYLNSEDGSAIEIFNHNDIKIHPQDIGTIND